MLALGAATLAAEAAVVPIAALNFGRIPLGGIAANAFAVPLMAVVQIAGAAASALTAVDHVVAGVAGYVAVAASRLLVATSIHVASWPASGWVTVPPGWTPIAVYYVGLGGRASRQSRVATRGGFALVLVAASVAILAPVRGRGRDGASDDV